MISTLTRIDEDVLAEIQAEMGLRRTEEVFLLFSMGSQFDHLIKLALDRLGVYCLVADPSSLHAADVMALSPKGIILSGGPASVHVEVPPFDTSIFGIGIPVLGICLGFQLWASYKGVPVVPASKREYGAHALAIYEPPGTELFDGIMTDTPVLQSHGDRVEEVDSIEVLAATEHSPVAAARHGHLWGVQFHPEVSETIDGERMLANFCFSICGAEDQFPAGDEAKRKITSLKEAVGDAKVLLALSGGSDSSVVAHLLEQAVPGQVHAVYIRGIDRPDDEAFVQQYFGDKASSSLTIVDATEHFLAALKGQETMHDKRVAMRGVYRDVLEKEAAACGASFIAQGTLYTDISESGTGYTSGARRAAIKLHHNTGLGFTLPELTPLDDCVKDTARQIGRAIGVPEELLSRHPFPGPGLVVRIEGEVDAEKLQIARVADAIYIEELRRHELYEGVWQAGAVITASTTTCTKGDDASTGLVVALWAVWSVNGFTAQWAELPYDFLRVVSRRMTNEIPAVGAVTYRISDKPPATIEWG